MREQGTIKTKPTEPTKSNTRNNAHARHHDNPSGSYNLRKLYVTITSMHFRLHLGIGWIATSKLLFDVTEKYNVQWDSRRTQNKQNGVMYSVTNSLREEMMTVGTTNAVSPLCGCLLVLTLVHKGLPLLAANVPRLLLRLSLWEHDGIRTLHSGNANASPWYSKSELLYYYSDR